MFTGTEALSAIDQAFVHWGVSFGEPENESTVSRLAYDLMVSSLPTIFPRTRDSGPSPNPSAPVHGFSIVLPFFVAAAQNQMSGRRALPYPMSRRGPCR